MAETDTILDNQEVTTDILNDIAIDLGATSFNGFGENKFGASELNQITGALVTSGILLTDDQCEPVILDGYLYIKTGTIIFESGAKKKITENLQLDLVNDSYVYALNDTALNVCKIVISTTEPSGDYVMLAHISSDSKLTDCRTYATAKFEQLYNTPISSAHLDTICFTSSGYSRYYDVSASHDTFKYMAIRQYGSNFKYDDVYTLIDIPNGTTIDSTKSIILNNCELGLYAARNGRKITIAFKLISGTGGAEASLDILFI